MALIICRVIGDDHERCRGLELARALGVECHPELLNAIVVDSNKEFEALRALLWEERISLGKLRLGTVNKDFKRG